VCIAGVCDGECKPDATRCSGLTPQKCNAIGKWESNGTACPYACSDGACTGDCKPNELRCSGLAKQKCDQQGKWQTNGSDCPYACDDGVCTGECKPNDLKCSGLARQKCDQQGKWQTNGSSCPFLCNAGACTGECKPSSEQCAGSSKTLHQTCSSSGSWSTGKIAPPCADCEPNDTECTSDHKQRKCDSNGHWGEGALSRTCGAACSVGEEGCKVMGTSTKECWGLGCFGDVTTLGDFVVTTICGPDGTTTPDQVCTDTCACRVAANGVATCSPGSGPAAP
jgi:hypothetical protein